LIPKKINKDDHRDQQWGIKLEGNKSTRWQSVWQYWAEHIVITVSSLVIGALVIILLRPLLDTVSRSAIPFVATIFATLLGLTFTSFAIFTAFLPNIRVDFLRTKTFVNEGKTFKTTIYVEILTMIISFWDYILFNTMFFVILLYVTVILMILSIGFFILLVRDTFLLFEIARKWKIEEK